MPNPFDNSDAASWVASYHGSVDTTALGLAHVAGQHAYRQALTETARDLDAVDALAKVIAEAQWQSGGGANGEWRWERLTEAKREQWRESARAALRAGYMINADELLTKLQLWRETHADKLGGMRSSLDAVYDNAR